jgi:hypothetical protein
MPESPGDPGRFQWSQLESGDYKEYVARLRAFGVPERQVRDIIIAEIQKLYRPRFAALRPKKVVNPNFWEQPRYRPFPRAAKEQRDEMAALEKEQRALIKTLLGEDVYEQMAKDSGWPDWTERMFGQGVSKASAEQAGEIQRRYQEAIQDIYERTDGYSDQETQGEINALKRKMREELKGVLTPEQLAEYELRTSDVANNMRWQLGSFAPNEQEFRAIFAYKQTMEEMNAQRFPDGERPSPDAVKALQEKQKETETALAAVMDADRLKEFKMMDRWEFQSLFESGASRETVFKVADMKQQTEDAARKLRQDKTLTPEQRQEKLQAIRAATEQELATLLGERRAKAYPSRGGSWVRNITGRD